MVKNINSSSDDFFSSTVVLVRFAQARDARSCQLTLDALFDRIREEVREVFKTGEGEATLEEIASVYADYGLTNENGWEQNHEILLSGNDVIWPLSFGVRRQDVEDLLSTMEPQGIEFHDVGDDVEQWRLYPIPETMPLPEFEDEE